jgi:hypothetical protein
VLANVWERRAPVVPWPDTDGTDVLTAGGPAQVAPAASARRALRGHHYLVLPLGVLIAAMPWLLRIDNRLWAAILATQIMVCALGIVGSYAGGVRPLRMVFNLFVLSWLGVGPLYQLSHYQLAWGDSGLLQHTDAVTAALAVNLSAVLAISVATWTTTASSRWRRVDDGREVVPRTWAPWGFLGLLTLLTPYVIATNGGLQMLFASRADRVSTLASTGATVDQGGGPQVALAVILPAALAVVSTHLFILRIRTAYRGGSLLATSLLDVLGLTGSLIGMALYCNPFSNTRFIAIAAFGSVALAVLRPRSPGAGRWMALGVSFITLGAYPLSNLLAPDGGEPAGASVLSVFASDDFDGFQQVINSMQYVHDHGYSLGRYVLSALFFVVPRSLWSWKATPSAIDVAENRGYWFTNLSTPVHIEFYLEFGIIGMLVFAWLLGHLIARIDTGWLTRPGSTAAWLAPYMCLAELGFIRGPLGSLAPVWLTVIVLLLVGVRRRPRSAARPDETWSTPAPAGHTPSPPWPVEPPPERRARPRLQVGRGRSGAAPAQPPRGEQ